jgi:hypothetical protein
VRLRAVPRKRARHASNSTLQARRSPADSPRRLRAIASRLASSWDRVRPRGAGLGGVQLEYGGVRRRAARRVGRRADRRFGGSLDAGRRTIRRARERGASRWIGGRHRFVALRSRREPPDVAAHRCVVLRANVLPVLARREHARRTSLRHWRPLLRRPRRDGQRLHSERAVLRHGARKHRLVVSVPGRRSMRRRRTMLRRRDARRDRRLERRRGMRELRDRLHEDQLLRGRILSRREHPDVRDGLGLSFGRAMQRVRGRRHQAARGVPVKARRAIVG